MVSLNLLFKNKIIKILAGNGSKIKERSGKFITKNKIFYYDNSSTGKNLLRYIVNRKIPSTKKIKLKKTPSLTSSIYFFLKNVRLKKKHTRDLYLSEKILKVLLAAEKSLKSRNLEKVK